MYNDENSKENVVGILVAEFPKDGLAAFQRINDESPPPPPAPEMEHTRTTELSRESPSRYSADKSRWKKNSRFDCPTSWLFLAPFSPSGEAIKWEKKQTERTRPYSGAKIRFENR